MSGALGGTDQRPAPRVQGRNQHPAPRAPSAPSLAWSSQSPVDPPYLFCPDLILGLGWHARESRSGAPRHVHAVSHALALRSARCAFVHMRAARAHIRASRRPYATACGEIMNDALLVCIRRCAYGQVDTGQPECKTR